jgi:hypothetical protein
MSRQLIDRNPDLKRLRDEGYEVEIRAGHLILKSVPYVNARNEIAFGILVSDLTLAGEKTEKPGNHVVWFAAEDHPHHKDGRMLTEITHQTEKKLIAPGLTVN